MIRCQILFYRPIEEIPGSYEVLVYNYKDGKKTTGLKEKKDNNVFHSLDLPDAQEAFNKAKEAISPWIKNNASASLLNISGDISGLYPEQILKGRADLWRVTLSVGQNVYKVEIRNGVPQYIDALSSSSDQAVLVPDSKEMVQRLENDGGTEWRDGLTGDEWYVYYSYPENGKFNISYRLNELRLDKKSFSKLY